MRHRRYLLVFGICLARLASSAAAQSETPADPAVWAPVDALAFVGVADLGAMQRELERSSLREVLSDPDLADYGGQLGFFRKTYADLPQAAGRGARHQPRAASEPVRRTCKRSSWSQRPKATTFACIR